ncbi:MerR family transcriptional regulator [Carnobacterium maltaromaticum]|uniref:MerR family transcriptional regulator n=1 Tax=Carnobacterium maltaromaticum TaxID=2751 RepID=UPI00295F0BC9|nr:MerR family transcriptional regulator [Carnobacterium maltaromaticum]
MKINEMAEMYDITASTLRYYEKIGLLVPRRDVNGYRIYDVLDIQKINIIRDLRGFGLSLKEIRSFLLEKNVDNTILILNKVISSLSQEIKSMEMKLNFLKDRKKNLEEKNNYIFNKVFVLNYPERQIILDDNPLTSIFDINTALKKLHKKFEKELFSINQNFFGSFLVENKKKITHRVFYFNYYTESIQSGKNFTLASGNYIALRYRGVYNNSTDWLEYLKTYISENNLLTEGHFIQIYLIDYNETNNDNEYVTQIEIKINDK